MTVIKDLNKRRFSLKRMKRAGIHHSWAPFFWKSEVYDSINKALSDLQLIKELAPKKVDIFKVFEMPKKNIKIVFLCGAPNKKSNGLGLVDNIFEESEEIKIIKIELERSHPGMRANTLSNSLYSWRNQGIFLLNSSLTSSFGAGHYKQWEKFIIKVIKELDSEDMIFVSFGLNAGTILKQVEKGIVLRAFYPKYDLQSGKFSSFLGSDIFIKINEKLKKLNKKEIRWL